MDFTFNELSLSGEYPSEVAKDILLQVATLFSELFDRGFRTAKFGNKNQFLSHPISKGRTIADWIKNFPNPSNKERILIQKLRSIITAASKIWDIDLQATIDSCPLIFVTYQDKQHNPEGLKIACILDTICVSIPSNKIWDSTLIEALWIQEGPQQKLNEQTISIRHASNLPHLEPHSNWIKSLLRTGKLFTHWNPSELFFPNLQYSNQLVEDQDWSVFYRIRDKSKNTDERRKVILFYGQQVAERNCYIYDQRISSINTTLNKKRVIYSAGTGKSRIYLSIDFETGGFEVCDYMGKHLGEYFYDGSKTKDAEPDHSIKVIK